MNLPSRALQALLAVNKQRPLLATVLPLRLSSVANQRQHWAIKAKTAAQHRLIGGLYFARYYVRLDPGIDLQLVVRLVRLAPRQLDSDNLASAFKALRDGIADGLGVPDSDPRVEFVVDQEKRKEYGVRIEVYGVRPNN